VFLEPLNIFLIIVLFPSPLLVPDSDPPAFPDGDILDRFVLRSLLAGFNFPNDVHPLRDPSENNVLAVEVGGSDGGDKKLRTVSTGTCVGHGKETGLLVFKVKVLILREGCWLLVIIL